MKTNLLFARPPSRPNHQASMMLLAPQRPHLSDEFSDHVRRQSGDPVLRHDQLTRPAPTVPGSTSYLGAEPRPNVHKVVRSRLFGLG
jgi:hypothetical protein